MQQHTEGKGKRFCYL